MDDKRPDGLSLSQEKTLQEFDEKISKQAETRLRVTKEQDEQLAKLVRRSTETGSLVKLHRFLEDQEIDMPKRNLMGFRDYLIINRLDMKDLEPAARARLRDKLLAIKDSCEMSDDYRQATCSGSVPRCRDCRWFVTAPDDGEENSDKSCVQMGTKGADVACVGFTYRPS